MGTRNFDDIDRLERIIAAERNKQVFLAVMLHNGGSVYDPILKRWVSEEKR